MTQNASADAPEPLASALTPFSTPFEETILYEVNRNAFNGRASADVFNEHFKRSLLEEDRLTLVIGTDSGLLIDYLRTLDTPPSSRYIFIEFPEVRDWLTRHGKLDDLPERIACATPETWLEQAREFNLQGYAYIYGFQVLDSLGAADAYLPEYAALSLTVNDQIRKIKWEVDTMGVEPFVRCQIKNLADHQLPSSVLAGAFRGKTAVLLAGGPSLDDFLPWVARHREHLVVLAVSRISKRLLEAGLAPDFVFTVDPHDVSFSVSKEMLDLPPQSHLVYSYHTVPTLVAQWPHQSFYNGDLFPWKSKLNRSDAIQSPGPTVTNFALEHAGAMGFGQVILAGVDLCYSPTGNSHAKGSHEHQLGPSATTEDLHVTTNKGDKADTNIPYLNASIALERQASKMREHWGTRILTISANAIRMEGIEYSPAEALSLPEEPAQVSETVGRLIEKSEGKSLRHNLTKVKEEINQAIHACQKIQTLSDEALTLNARFHQNARDGESTRKAKAGMDKIEKELKTTFRKHARLVKKLGIRELLKIVDVDSKDASDMALEEITEKLDTYYKSFKDGARRLEAMLVESRERIRQRELEAEPTATLAAVHPYWKAQREQERLKLFLSRHPEQATESALIEQIHAEIRENRDQADALILETLRRRSKPEDFLPRIITATKHKDRETLARVRNALANHPDGERAKYYVALADGIIARMNGQHEAALQAFEPIINDQSGQILEFTMQQVASSYLDLSLAEQATTALSILSELNPMYRSKLIKLYRLSRNYEPAIDVADIHLKQFPQDSGTQLEIADLYKDIGSEESAMVMLNYILTHDPDNVTAKTRLAALTAASGSTPG